VKARMNKYTASGPSTAPVSTINLPPALSRPFSAQAPPSPTASMRTYPSANMPMFGSPTNQQVNVPPTLSMPNPSVPNFPAQQARLPQSHSHGDVSSLQNQGRPPSRDEKMPRSASMILTPGGSTNGGWVDGMAHLQIAEPKIFPGVVQERTRRNSLRHGSSSENIGDGTAGSALSKTSTKDWDAHSIEDVVEEEERED